MEKVAAVKKSKADRIQLIDTKMIDRPAKIARETIDPEHVRELAESIRESGLQQPIKVRPVNGRYEIVFGDRRYLAHKLLELKKIKAIIPECRNGLAYFPRLWYSAPATKSLPASNRKNALYACLVI